MVAIFLQLKVNTRIWAMTLFLSNTMSGQPNEHVLPSVKKFLWWEWDMVKLRGWRFENTSQGL
jgi:hypothetical protein